MNKNINFGKGTEYTRLYLVYMLCNEAYLYKVSVV